MAFPPAIESALERLERGAADLISRDELGHKLMRAQSEGRPLRVKLGLDPTAPDIHLGFAVVLRKLRAFQDLGHEAHLIIGDFTATIGDPSGKSKTRPQLSREQVRAHAATYQQQLFRILDPERTRVHFNADWLGAMGFADVIALAARYTVAQTLEREDFARRLNENRPIGLHELLYPLCQGQDSVQIRADVELGGSDQRFNNLVGRELQRQSGLEPQVVLLLPILPGLDGTQKMSKSLGNYVGIGEAPEEQFGKLMSLPDEAMPVYFTLCTDLETLAIEELLQGHPMEAKKRLGQEIVRLYHGAEAADLARESFEKQFSRREEPEMPEFVVGPELLNALDLLSACFGVSRSEARRLIGAGAVALDGDKIQDALAPLQARDGAALRMGKRSWARLRLPSSTAPSTSSPSESNGGEAI